MGPNYDGEESNPEAQYELFDSFCFVLTTVSTVGYGSHIKSTFGKFIIIAVIVRVVGNLQGWITRLIELANSKSRYARMPYVQIKDVPHIVLIGSVNIKSLQNFLEEYLHPDHDAGMRHCVLMMPHRPDPQMELMMMKPEYMSALYYIEGSTFDQKALKRCRLEKARAVIILSDKFSYDAEHEDTHTILEAMIIKKYLGQQKKKIEDDVKR